MIPSSKKATLASAGITKLEANRCEAIADATEEEFEEAIEQATAKGKSVTLSAAEKNGRARKKRKKRQEAVAAIAEAAPSSQARSG